MTAAVERPRSEHARRERRQFLSNNAIAAAGTWMAGILGLLLQALVSHHFRPVAYGQVFAVFSFFTVLTQPAAGFSRLIAWSTSRELATHAARDQESQQLVRLSGRVRRAWSGAPGPADGGHGDDASSALLRLTNRRLLILGVLLSAGFIVTAPWLGSYLNVPPSFVILGAVGVPFMLSAAPLMASLQGEQRWVPWSALSAGIALSRVVFVAALVPFFGLEGVLLGISVAAVVIYGVCVVMVWPRLRRGRQPSGWRPVWRFLVVSVASTVTVSILMGSDVVLVEHFFGGAAGGQFSAVTVTSRALFFAMGSVSSVLFPTVAARHVRSRRTRSVVFASLGFAVIGGVVGLLAFSLGSHFILRSFSGRAYEAGSDYIGWYALGMPLLAAVVMLSNTQQSLADLRLLWILVPGALLKPLLIVLFHQSLLVVSLMSDVAIAAIVVTLTVAYLASERRLGSEESPGVAEGGPILPTAQTIPPAEFIDPNGTGTLVPAADQAALDSAFRALSTVIQELDGLATEDLNPSEPSKVVQ
jgi:O-antigen/teichoic acid export membrane protein